MTDYETAKHESVAILRALQKLMTEHDMDEEFLLASAAYIFGYYSSEMTKDEFNRKLADKRKHIESMATTGWADGKLTKGETRD